MTQRPAARTTGGVRFLAEPVQYHPGEQPNKETSNRIRAHIAQYRRLKKQQILLNPQQIQETNLLDRSFCLCSVVPRPAVIETGRATSRAAQKQRAIADSYKICPRCRKLQFNELSWLGKLKVANARIPSVSAWLEAEFDPFQSLPELSSIQQSPNTRRSLNELKAHLLTFWPYDNLRSTMLAEASKDPAMFMSCLYLSAANLNAMKGGGETPLIVAIKIEAIRQMNLRLNETERQNNYGTVATMGFLASGVQVFGSGEFAKEVQQHEDAMLTIVNGFKWTIPDGDLVGKGGFKLFVIHYLDRCATKAIPVQDLCVTTYCQPFPTISDLEYLPESPLFCPRPNFYTLSRCSRCSSHTLRILRSARKLVDFMVEGNIDDDYEKTRSDLLSMPPVTTGGDYIYESCRLAALLMIQANDAQIPFAQLDVPLIKQLKSALQKTDIGDFWGTMAGVLFWVGLVGCTSAMWKPEHPFMNSLMLRGELAFTFKGIVFEGAAIAAYKFQRIHMRLVNSEVHNRLTLPLRGSLVDFSREGE